MNRPPDPTEAARKLRQELGLPDACPPEQAAQAFRQHFEERIRVRRTNVRGAWAIPGERRYLVSIPEGWDEARKAEALVNLCGRHFLMREGRPNYLPDVPPSERQAAQEAVLAADDAEVAWGRAFTAAFLGQEELP
jgi:hypothetical protein